MANPLRKLPTKAGRTKPSSRVKKMKKKVSRNFSEPREEYDINDDLMPDHRRNLTYVAPAPRGYETRKRVKRKEDAEDARSASQATERKVQRLGRDAPVKTSVNGIYHQLRENLSPANQRLLDILAGRGGSNFQDGERYYTQKEMEEMIPF